MLLYHLLLINQNYYLDFFHKNENSKIDYKSLCVFSWQVLALFCYHKDDTYRTEGKQYPLAKVSEAIKYHQKDVSVLSHCVCFCHVEVYSYIHTPSKFNYKGSIYLRHTRWFKT